MIGITLNNKSKRKKAYNRFRDSTITSDEGEYPLSNNKKK